MIYLVTGDFLRVALSAQRYQAQKPLRVDALKGRLHSVSVTTLDDVISVGVGLINYVILNYRASAFSLSLSTTLILQQLLLEQTMCQYIRIPPDRRRKVQILCDVEAEVFDGCGIETLFSRLRTLEVHFAPCEQ